MRVLLTGASSFTGYWFVRELTEAGHTVFATYTRASVDEYEGVRGKRVSRLSGVCQQEFACRFGDDRFLDLVGEVNPDVLCHHAAEVTEYKSPDFDYAAALQANTLRLPEVLRQLNAVDCRRVVLTGTVFEEYEGAGNEPSVSFSPYGLSKALTDRVYRHFVCAAEMSLGKFVIPNPFGPLEEPRFTAYLARCWNAGDVAQVRTPAYVRDNIHASLLAKAYRLFVESLPETGFTKINPSGYVETQGAFATRFANELRKRLPWACELEFGDQFQFDEPPVRINTTPIDVVGLNWDESRAWDAIAEYYETELASGGARSDA
ncbi:NAD-dependent epimerase/dehydratase family protein [Aeoliella sp.]|uniref:NAD-dependent epimerase/dehydratase family protein n=1 Tax=Aeoliella sp. TaxID=2795800 RepID=UPI003CCBE77E